MSAHRDKAGPTPKRPKKRSREERDEATARYLAAIAADPRGRKRVRSTEDAA